MEEFIKIERDKLYSVIAKYRPYDKIGMLDDLSNDLFELSETEVSTYTEDEFLKEKHHFLNSESYG